MVNPLDPNAGSGGGLKHKFGGGPNNTEHLPGTTQLPLHPAHERAPRNIPAGRAPKQPKAAKQPAPPRTATPHTPSASPGGASPARTPTTIHLRTPVFANFNDSNPFNGSENPSVANVFVNPVTGQLFGLAGGHLFPLGHHPQASGKTSAQSRRASPHSAEPTRATVAAYDAASNTAQVYPSDQSDGQPITVHVNPDIAPSRMVAGAVVGLSRGSDTDYNDATATYIAG